MPTVMMLSLIKTLAFFVQRVSPIPKATAAWFLLCGLGVFARDAATPPDPRKLHFEPLEMQDTYPGGEVSQIIEGPHGFIWLGTRAGAHRYDGYTIRTYAHLKEDSTSLVNSIVQAFHIDARERLWIGTEKGISRYDEETERFANYLLDRDEVHSNLSNHTNAILHDSGGVLYATSESGFVYRYEEQDDRFVRINRGSLGIIKSMAIDNDDRLWIGGAGSLYRLDPETLELDDFSAAITSSDPAAINFISSILYVEDEEIWIGTALEGVVVLDSVTGEARAMESLTPADVYVHALYEDCWENIWICHGEGITVHENATGDVIRLPLLGTSQSLPSSGIRSLYFDSQGNAWVGSEHHGVYLASRNKAFERFQPYASQSESAPVVSALLHDSEGNLWVGLSSAGVDVFPPDGGSPRRYRHIPGDETSIGAHTVFALYEDSDHQIWVGSYNGGLQRFDPQTEAFVTYRHDPSDPSSIPGNDVRAIQEDENGNLWLITHGQGVTVFDRESSRFINYRAETGSDSPSIIDDWLNAMHYGSDGLLYLGSAIGLSVLDPETGRIRNFQPDPQDPEGFSNPTINTIFEDSKGAIWLGTNDGINRFDVRTGRSDRISVEEGLPNRVAVSIAEDDAGRLWIGTTSGLARFDPGTEEIRSYDEGDGLAHNEFYPRAVSRGEQGRIYFGQKNGITHFLPDEIVENPHLPEVHITDFQIFNRSLPIVPGSDSPYHLERNILATSSLTLAPDQKVITIEYVALNFIQSQKNKYAYKLDGFDEEWIEAGNRRQATYTNLPPGTYQFHVRASNNDGFWNEGGRTLELVVAPAYWQTWWFRAIMASFIVLLPTFLMVWRTLHGRRQRVRLEATVRARTRELERTHAELEHAYRELETIRDRIQAQNNELLSHRQNLEAMVHQRTSELAEAKERAESSDRLKSAFLANVSHEIRTPMNAIMGFIEILREDDLTPAEREDYRRIINQSADTLLRLIDDILDLSKIEAGETVMHPERTNIDILCEELWAIFVQLAEKEKGSDVRILLERNGHAGESLPVAADYTYILIDGVRLKQVLSNLLANALKFTESGEIRFGYRIERGTHQPEESRVHFFVHDTGIGVPSDQLEAIFDRFHKVERENRLYQGTGLGLSITKRLVEMMEGEIEVTSTEGRGTHFHLDFPLRHPPENLGAVPTERRGSRIRIFTKKEDLPDLGGLTILVAEDEDPNFEFIRKSLVAAGAVVHRAVDGEDALDQFRNHAYDLIVLDMKMPRMNGFEVARRIRLARPDIPIVAQTAFAMIEDQEASLEAGASTYLAKPFTRADLLGRISDLVGREMES